MSALAKVLVVLNLILALFFLGVSATVFVSSENWKENSDKLAKQYDTSVKELEGALGDYQTQKEQRESDLASVRNEVRTLESAKNDLQGEVDDLTSDKAKQQQKIDELMDMVAQKDRHIEQKDGEISRLSDRLDEAQTVAQNADDAKSEAEKNYARARLDKQQLAKENEALSIELAQTKSDLEEKSTMIAVAQDKGLDFGKIIGTKPAPAIDGAVVAVSDEEDVNLVVFSVGANDKVEEGHEFTIFRGGQFIGKAKVSKVTADMAGARILFLEDGASVQIGDKVTTRMN